jgi:hypothetical protein
MDDIETVQKVIVPKGTTEVAAGVAAIAAPRGGTVPLAYVVVERPLSTGSDLTATRVGNHLELFSRVKYGVIVGDVDRYTKLFGPDTKVQAQELNMEGCNARSVNRGDIIKVPCPPRVEGEVYVGKGYWIVWHGAAGRPAPGSTIDLVADSRSPNVRRILLPDGRYAGTAVGDFPSGTAPAPVPAPAPAPAPAPSASAGVTVSKKKPPPPREVDEPTAATTSAAAAPAVVHGRIELMRRQKSAINAACPHVTKILDGFRVDYEAKIRGKPLDGILETSVEKELQPEVARVIGALIKTVEGMEEYRRYLVWHNPSLWDCECTELVPIIARAPIPAMIHLDIEEVGRADEVRPPSARMIPLSLRHFLGVRVGDAPVRTGIARRTYWVGVAWTLELGFEPLYAAATGSIYNHVPLRSADGGVHIVAAYRLDNMDAFYDGAMRGWRCDQVENRVILTPTSPPTVEDSERLAGSDATVWKLSRFGVARSAAEVAADVAAAPDKKPRKNVYYTTARAFVNAIPYGTDIVVLPGQLGAEPSRTTFGGVNEASSATGPHNAPKLPVAAAKKGRKANLAGFVTEEGESQEAEEEGSGEEEEEEEEGSEEVPKKQKGETVAKKKKKKAVKEEEEVAELTGKKRARGEKAEKGTLLAEEVYSTESEEEGDEDYEEGTSQEFKDYEEEEEKKAGTSGTATSKVVEGPLPCRVLVWRPVTREFVIVHAGRPGEVVLFAAELSTVSLLAADVRARLGPRDDRTETAFIGGRAGASRNQEIEATESTRAMEAITRASAQPTLDAFARRIVGDAPARSAFEDMAKAVLSAADRSHLGTPLAMRAFESYMAAYSYNREMHASIPVPVRYTTKGVHPTPKDPATVMTGGWTFDGVRLQLPCFFVPSPLEKLLRGQYAVTSYVPRSCFFKYLPGDDQDPDPEPVYCLESATFTVDPLPKSGEDLPAPKEYVATATHARAIGGIEGTRGTFSEGWKLVQGTLLVVDGPVAGPYWAVSYVSDVTSTGADVIVLSPMDGLGAGESLVDWLPLGSDPDSFVRLTADGQGRRFIEAPGRVERGRRAVEWTRLPVNPNTVLLSSFSFPRSLLVAVTGAADLNSASAPPTPAESPRDVSIYLLHPETGVAFRISRLRESHRIEPVVHDWNKVTEGKAKIGVKEEEEEVGPKKKESEELREDMEQALKSPPVPVSGLPPQMAKDRVPVVAGDKDPVGRDESSLQMSWTRPAIELHQYGVRNRAVPINERHGLMIMSEKAVCARIYAKMLSSSAMYEASGYAWVEMMCGRGEEARAQASALKADVDMLYALASADQLPAARVPIPTDNTLAKRFNAWASSLASRPPPRTAVVIYDASAFGPEFGALVPAMFAVESIVVWSFICVDPASEEYIREVANTFREQKEKEAEEREKKGKKEETVVIVPDKFQVTRRDTSRDLEERRVVVIVYRTEDVGRRLTFI